MKQPWELAPEEEIRSLTWSANGVTLIFGDGEMLSLPAKWLREIERRAAAEERQAVLDAAAEEETHDFRERYERLMQETDRGVLT